MTDDQVLQTFISREDVIRVIANLKSQIELEAETSKRKDKSLYRQQVFVKMNLIFRRQIVLTEKEACDFYNSHYSFLKDRVDLFYEIIDKINNDINVAYIPDKLTLCSFFRVSAEIWENFINNYSVDEKVRSLFLSLEEFIISMTTTGIEIGQLSPSAFNKMRLKGKFGGNNLEYHEQPRSTAQTIINMQESTETKYLANKYNFKQLEDKSN